MSELKRLLLLGCTQKKRPDVQELSALDRYDGPLFRVLRKFDRENNGERARLDIYVLSAKFGLIPVDRLIPNYDYAMTPSRALELRSQILAQLQQILQKSYYNELFINVGRHYMSALQGYDEIIPDGMQIFTSRGSLGRRQVELQGWLAPRDDSSNKALPIKHSGNEKLTPTASQGIVYLRGVEIHLEPTQVYEIARQFLPIEPVGAANYQSWYVEVDSERVSPKWLVSKLTGIPVGSFHSSEARRVLMQLGIEVERK